MLHCTFYPPAFSHASPANFDQPCHLPTEGEDNDGVDLGLQPVEGVPVADVPVEAAGEVEYVNVTSTLLHVTALKTYVTEMMARESGFQAEFSVSGGSGFCRFVSQKVATGEYCYPYHPFCTIYSYLYVCIL